MSMFVVSKSKPVVMLLHRGAPYYLGSLRSRPPGSHSPLLAFRPGKLRKPIHVLMYTIHLKRILFLLLCRGAPLYLGSLRSRPPGSYSALLAFRPDKPGPGAVAVVGSNLSSREPRFSLLFAGHLVTLCDRDGLFKVLLMWLQYHLVERQGLVGGR